MRDTMRLRAVEDDDLPVFFAQQLDAEARQMAAFTVKDPTDRAAFLAYWRRNLANPTAIHRTIMVDGAVVGSVASYADEGRQEVTYWLGREYWGRGLATSALALFLRDVNTVRPIYGRVAKDNIPSRRVLEKCGFRVVGEERGFANARGTEIDELLLELR